MTKANLITIENGGVSSAKGFRAGGIHAGFRDDPNRLDMALVEADELCPAAGVFTQNVFCAAPVTVSREHLDGVGYGFARAMVINSASPTLQLGQLGSKTPARLPASLPRRSAACPKTCWLPRRVSSVSSLILLPSKPAFLRCTESSAKPRGIVLLAPS